MSSFQNICEIMHFFVCDDYKLLRNCEVLILLLLLLILHSFLKTKYISCKGQSNTMINNAFPFVIQLNCFMILMIDDYHNIHTKKVPTQLITSSAVHMASCLVDIHPTIMAVARPLHTPIHRVVQITIKGEEIDCYGGIDIQIVNQKMQQALANMKKPFMKQLPPLMLQLSPKELHESLRQLRQVNNI